MSPFDETRYARLLEGLEVSEVMLSYALTNNEIFRIDSTYFQNQFLAEESIIRIKGGHRLGEIGAQIRSFGAYSLNNEVTYLDAGVPFIRGVNMKGGRVNFSDMFYISNEAHALLWKSEVTKGMVLLSMSGTVGDVAIATNHWEYPVNSNQDIAKIDTAGALNPFTLYAFLLSRFGQNYLKREARDSVQQHVFLSQIEQFEIPVFTAKFDKAIQRTVEESEAQHVEAASCLASAEIALLRALNLDDRKTSEPLSYLRNSSEAFAAGRLDAEFFTPRVRDMLARLGRDGLTIHDVAPARKERFTPADGGDFHYIEIGGLGADGTAQAECLPQREAPSRATQFVRAGDVITSTVRPIRRLSAAIDDSQDGYVCSSGFVVLQPRAISSDVLLTYLRLPPVCTLMDLHTSATMYPAISESDLLALPIPAITPVVQV